MGVSGIFIYASQLLNDSAVPCGAHWDASLHSERILEPRSSDAQSSHVSARSRIEERSSR